MCNEPPTGNEKLPPSPPGGAPHSRINTSSDDTRSTPTAEPLAIKHQNQNQNQNQPQNWHAPGNLPILHNPVPGYIPAGPQPHLNMAPVVLPPVTTPHHAEVPSGTLKPQLPPLRHMFPPPVVASSSPAPMQPKPMIGSSGFPLNMGPSPRGFPLPANLSQAQESLRDTAAMTQHSPSMQVRAKSEDSEVNEADQNVAMSVFMAESDAAPIELANGRFQCPLCPKSYKYSKHVRRHIINHTNIYPYSCPRCHAPFRRKDARRRHIQRIHPELPSSSYMHLRE